MNIRYKLTSQNLTTHNGFKIPLEGWFYPEDRTSKPKPCTNTVLHHYADPHLAILFNPRHANFNNPRMFEIEIDEEIGTDELKGWCRAQRIIREIPVPIITTKQRVAFAIYCAEPFGNDKWQKWAADWMSGVVGCCVGAANAAAYAAVNAANKRKHKPDFLAIVKKVFY